MRSTRPVVVGLHQFLREDREAELDQGPLDRGEIGSIQLAFVLGVLRPKEGSWIRSTDQGRNPNLLTQVNRSGFGRGSIL